MQPRVELHFGFGSPNPLQSIDARIHRLAGRGRWPVLIVLALSCASAPTSMQMMDEVNITMPSELAREYGCSDRVLPFFRLEKIQPVEERGHAGRPIAHRLTYVLCARSSTEVVTGALDTRVLFQGNVLYQEALPYDLKAGRWRIETAVPLPDSAGPGVYALHVDFTSEAGGFEGQSDFIVEGPRR